MSKNKKGILKKYIGAGKLAVRTVGEIPRTLKTSAKNLVRGRVLKAVDPAGLVKGALRRTGNMVARGMKIEDNVQKIANDKAKKFGDEMSGKY